MEIMSSTAKSVLIVEDDLILSMVLVRMMEKLEFDVLKKCHAGQCAIESAKELQPELVLMDIQLNGDIDGISAMEEIRTFSEVPVIYITGNSDRKNIDRARKTNFVDYLVKPVQMNELKQTVEKVFSYS